MDKRQEAKVLKLVKKYNKLREKVSDGEKLLEALKDELKEQVNKVQPNLKESGTIYAGEWKVIRSARSKYEWDKEKLKEALGQELFNSIIETTVKISNGKLDDVYGRGLIKKEQLKGTFKIKYEQALYVNPKNQEEKENGKPVAVLKDIAD